MEVLFASCPMCGARYDGALNSRHLICAYCDAHFVLSEEEAKALGIGDEPAKKSGKPQKKRFFEEDNYEGSEQPMVDYARSECEEFLKHADPDDFEDTSKVRRGLGLQGANVLLIHDDTIFKSGKNGFAITTDGFYCHELGEPTEFTSWEKLARSDDKPDTDSSTVKVDGVSVVYFTGNDDTLEDLRQLVRKLVRHARRLYA